MKYIKKLAEFSYEIFFPLVNRVKIYFQGLKKDIKFINWNISFEEYIALVIFSSLIFSILIFMVSLIIMWLLFAFIDSFVILLAFLYSVIVFLLLFIYFISYPKLARMDYEKDIEDNLPFFLLYFYGFVSSGMNILDAFRISAKRKEFGSLSKEIQHLVYLTDILGYDLLSALMEIAKKTPSAKFKEFLYELFSVIKSGGSIRDLTKEFAKSSLYEYELKLKSFSEKSTFLLTLYTFLFIAFPLVLLIMAFLFAYSAKSITILTSLKPFLLGFIPFGYIIYLYVLYLVQPRI